MQKVFAPLGGVGHTDRERVPLDYYATDPQAVELLLQLEDFQERIWEPAAGEGHITDVLIEHGHRVLSEDIVSRRMDIIERDFFSSTEPWEGDLITNPPYNQSIQFIEHAMKRLREGSKMALFLKVLFLEGRARKGLFEKYPPIRVWVSSSRLKCAPNGDFSAIKSSATAYAWFIWEVGYEGPPTLGWFN